MIFRLIFYKSEASSTSAVTVTGSSIYGIESHSHHIPGWVQWSKWSPPCNAGEKGPPFPLQVERVPPLHFRWSGYPLYTSCEKGPPLNWWKRSTLITSVKKDAPFVLSWKRSPVCTSGKMGSPFELQVNRWTPQVQRIPPMHLSRKPSLLGSQLKMVPSLHSRWNGSPLCTSDEKGPPLRPLLKRVPLWSSAKKGPRLDFRWNGSPPCNAGKKGPLFPLLERVRPLHFRRKWSLLCISCEKDRLFAIQVKRGPPFHRNYF